MTLKKYFGWTGWTEEESRRPRCRTGTQWQQNQVSSRKKGLANYKIILFEFSVSPCQLFKARRIVDRLFCIISEST